MAMKPQDLTGQKFGKLTVIKLHHKKEFLRKDRNRKEYKYYWICKCECGNEIIVDGNSLKLNRTKSCGCYKKEHILKIIKEKNIKHNMTHTKLYRRWLGIKARCYIKNTENYKYYGGRGIIMCNEWKNDFRVFYNWAINNGYNENLTIDRIDVNGNYEPNNCRWVNRKIQMNNTTSNYNIEYNEQNKTLSEWSNFLNIPINTLHARIHRLNWSVEKAFTTPIRKIKKSKNTKF